MPETSLQTARWVSSVAATLISLGCGSNYVYSAWGPQFGEKLRLSSTQQNLIGVAGNLGQYSLGIPVGILVDSKGPRIAAVLGAILLAIGYFPLHQAYDRGSGSMTMLCLYSYCSGLGGCSAFAAAIKTSALNWPRHRGTATGVPLAAFGLSAFFFSMFAQFMYPGSTGDFLFLLSCGTLGLVLIPLFFLRVIPPPHYSAIPSREPGFGEGQLLHRTRSEESKYRASRAHPEEPGMSSSSVPYPDPAGATGEDDLGAEAPGGLSSEETSSLMSGTGASSAAILGESNVKDRAHRVDIRGLKMLHLIEFWQLFVLMGILTGIGLMTINNIGNDATALWRHYDDSASEDFINQRQAMHVSILSVCSFLGRLASGLGSDFLVKVLKASRLWCLTVAALVFLVAQVLALSIQNPHYLSFVSGLTGLGYGFLFGCFPSLVAEAFGIHGLSTNWGFMTLSPVISGNVFNLFYGMIYDHHSVIKGEGERECTEGLACYRSAYIVTVAACLVGLSVSLWSIHYTHKARQEEKGRDFEHRDA